MHWEGLEGSGGEGGGRWGIGMGNTCKPMAVSFQCMTKSTTIKNKQKNPLNSTACHCAFHLVAYKGNGSEILRGKIFLRDGHRCNQGFRMHEEISLSYVENALNMEQFISQGCQIIELHLKS